jgi:hypothetical protein
VTPAPAVYRTTGGRAEEDDYSFSSQAFAARDTSAMDLDVIPAGPLLQALERIANLEAGMGRSVPPVPTPTPISPVANCKSRRRL